MLQTDTRTDGQTDRWTDGQTQVNLRFQTLSFQSREYKMIERIVLMTHVENEVMSHWKFS
jgi:hypothetical protein